jgi:hypothetical protein
MARTVAVVTIVIMVSIAGYLVGSMLYSIRQERRRSRIQKVWANFGLSIAFCVLFLTSWAAQALAEWQVWKGQQQAHDEPLAVIDFLNEFAQSTLENWQSEFLQLFSFVVLAALLIHHGSAESKDSDDRMERKIDEIKQQVEQLAGKR